MARDEDSSSTFNYAGPGAHVGIQCQHITVGSIRVDADGVTINGAVIPGDDSDNQHTAPGKETE